MEHSFNYGLIGEKELDLIEDYINEKEIELNRLELGLSDLKIMRGY